MGEAAKTPPVIANAFTSRSEESSKLVKQCSVNLWKRVNAGYVIPKRELIGSTHEAYRFDPKLVDKKSYEFHRKRDAFTDYGEAAFRLQNIFGNPNPNAPSNKKRQAGANAAAGKGKGKSAGTSAASSPPPAGGDAPPPELT